MSTERCEKEICGPSREKHWSELSQEEKIERVRGVVKTQEKMLKSLQKSFYWLQTFIEKHSHSNDGKLLMRIGDDELRQASEVLSPPPCIPGGRLMGKPENKDEVYF